MLFASYVRRFGDDADNPHYIETLAKRGYRFLAEVAVTVPERSGAEAAAARQVPWQTRSRLRNPLPDQPSTWRSTLRLWQLAAAGVALLSVGLGLAWWLRPVAPRRVEAVRITANPVDAPVTGAVISPDGKYVAYSDSTGAYIRHIDSGETRPLALPKGFEGIPTSWFPDSTHLLVGNHEGAKQIAKIWKVSILGGNPQMVMEDAEQGLVSPDGLQMVSFRGEAGTRDLWLADSDGQNAHRLVAHEPEHAGKITDVWSATWSQDGRRIGYLLRDSVPSNFPNGDRYSLNTRKADGSDPRLVLQDRRMNSLLDQTDNILPPPLYWAPNGRLYYAEQSLTTAGGQATSIWSIAVDTDSGARRGRPQELLGSLEWIGGFSSSQAGNRLVFWRRGVTVQAFVGEFDGNTGKMSAPRRLTLDQSSEDLPMDWTADSRAVVLQSRRNGKNGIYKQGLEETTAQVLLETRTPQVSAPRLSGDGKEILYTQAESPNDPTAPVKLMATPITGGSSRAILSQPGVNNYLCAKLPSSDCILNEWNGVTNVFYLLDLDHGKGRRVAEVKGESNWGLSPDGSTLVLSPRAGQERLIFVSVETGAIKESEVKGWSTLKSADWAADSKSVLMASVTPAGIPVVLRVDRDGKAKVVLEFDRQTPVLWVIPSPDGKYGALAMLTGESNVWMVENY